MVSEHERSDAGDSDMPKRSCKVPPLCEKVKVFNLVRKGKDSFAEVAKMQDESESSMHATA